MKLSGTLEANLEAAIVSARRLRGKHVYADTLTYWRGLSGIAWAGVEGKTGAAAANLKRLASELDKELLARSR